MDFSHIPDVLEDDDAISSDIPSGLIDMPNEARLLNFLSGQIRPSDSRFYCPDTINEYTTTIYPRQPDFHVIPQDTGDIEIRFDRVESVSTVGASIHKTMHNANNVVHDFTFQCFTDSTDKRLDTIRAMGDGSDRLTPDEILILEDEIVVVEFTTYRHDFQTANRARPTYNSKIDRYYEFLKSRVDTKPISFFVIVVTPNSVWTNVCNVPQYWADELCFRYRLAMRISLELENTMGMSITRSNELSTASRNTRAILDRIPLTLTSGHFTEQDVESLGDGNFDMDIVKNHLRVAMKKAVDSFYVENALPNRGVDEPMTQREERDIVLKEALGRIQDSTKDGRSDLKSCIQLPLMVLTKAGVSNLLTCKEEYPHITYEEAGENSVMMLFKEAFELLETGEEDLIDGDAKEVLMAYEEGESRMEYEQSCKPHRQSYRRAKVENLSEEAKMHLGCIGVNGKNWERESSYVAEYREKKKQPFSYDVETSDIDDYIQNSDLFQKCPNYDFMSQTDRTNLIETAYDLSRTSAQGKEVMLKILTDFEDSRLGQYTHMMSLVGTEISISIQQHCRRDVWIVKRVRGYPLYLLIKPTDSTKHIFFSLLWRVEDEEWASTTTVHKRIQSHGDWRCIDMISYNRSKLTNLILSEARALSLTGLAMEHSRCNLLQGDSLFNEGIVDESISRARRFVNMSMLMSMHDKSCVDEAVSDIRFCMMEGFKFAPQFPDPGKKMMDIPTIIRSRVHAWVYKRMFCACNRILDMGGFSSTQNSQSGCTWTGLFDALTGDTLDDFQQLTNTFYYNYLKNKDETPMDNATIKMMDKILDYENKRPDTDDYLGQKSNEDAEYDFHEFSPDLIKFFCDVCATALKARLGNDWKNQLNDDILHSVSSIDIESLCTLKASAAFSELDQDGINSRPRTMSAILDVWRQVPGATHAIHLLPHCVKTLHESGGLFVDLFKKNQHGGLREIYVLSAESRVVQAIVESISRSICKQFPSEMMTHPSHKLRASGMHTTKARRELSTKQLLTVCTSDDASKWNQGHYVKKFFIMLAYFTEPYMHDFLASALDLWLCKNIRIPAEMIRLMDKMNLDSMDKFKYLSPVSKQLLTTYKGANTMPWMLPGKKYITTETGMMQGILHYTSSLFHTIIQESMVGLGKGVFSRVNLKCSISVMQSSDDSGMLISVPVETKYDKFLAYVVSNQVFHLKYHLAQMIGIYKSNKCTTGTANVLEFNSEYYDHGNLIRPTAKWVFACHQLPECESLYARQEGFHSLASQVLEGGGSFLLTAICQMSQALLHYLMLGCQISAGWFPYADKIQSMPDPSLGFFLMDDPVSAGLGTLKYLLYLSLTGSEALSRKYNATLTITAEKLSESRDKGDMLDSILGLLTTGSVTTTSLVRYGNQEKWKRFFSDLNLPDDWAEQIESQPNLLYRRAETPDELELRVAVKATGPGVMASMNSGNVISRAVSSSVYILTRSVLTTIDPDSMHNTIKTTLLNKLRKDMIWSAEYDTLSDEQYFLLFPHHPSYVALTEVKSNVKLSGRVDTTPRRRAKSDLVVFDAPVNETYSLERVLTSIWFSRTFPASLKYRDSLYSQYQLAIPWLDRDVCRCLEKSPFVNHRQLQNFISRQDFTDRVVHLNCNPIPGRKGNAIIETVLYKNMWVNWTADTLLNKERVVIHKHYEKICQELFMVSQMPVTDEIKSRLCCILLEKAPLIQPPTATSHIRNPLVGIYLMQNLIKKVGISHRPAKFTSTEKVEEIESWLESCHQYGSGVFGHFLLRQKFNKKTHGYYGAGVWIGRLDTSPVRIEINSDAKGTYLSRIYVRDPTEFLKNVCLLRSWCKECGVSIRESKYRLSREEKASYRIDARNFAPSISAYPPIIKNNQLDIKTIDDRSMDYSTVQLEYKSGCLRVTGSVKSLDSNVKYTKITIQQCTIANLDSKIGVLDPCTLDVELTMWSQWIARVPLSPSEAHTILHGIDTLYDDLGFESLEECQKWFRSLFWETVRVLGITTSYGAGDQQEEEACMDLGEFDELCNPSLGFESLENVFLDENPLVQDVDGEGMDMMGDELQDIFGEGDYWGNLSVVSNPKMSHRLKRIYKPLLSAWILEDLCFRHGKRGLSIFLESGSTFMLKGVDMDILIWISGVNPAKDEEGLERIIGYKTLPNPITRDVDYSMEDEEEEEEEEGPISSNADPVRSASDWPPLPI